MESSTDPPATTSGIFIIKIISADYGENPYSIFPFVLSGIIGAVQLVYLFLLRSVLSLKIITCFSNFAYITHWRNWFADILTIHNKSIVNIKPVFLRNFFP